MKLVKSNSENYEKLLSEVLNHVRKTEALVTRGRVEMAWNIGRSIEQNLGKIEKKRGDQLIERLAKEVKINANMLYRMRRFYQTYPKLPRDEEKLNWTHYRVLTGVKQDDERKFLEDLTREKNLTSDALIEEVKKIKSKKTKPKEIEQITKLRPQRGRVFCYKIVERKAKGARCLDLGFGIFREVEEKIPAGAKIVETVKKGESYSLQKSSAEPRQIYIYKAYLTRVVDGDTIHVDLDLGFGIFHEEILRLRAIDAAEATTPAGRRATYGLNKILKNLPFLILKSNRNDIYGRYVADIYLPDAKGKMSPQEVADSGVYLNQLLLDKGLVSLF